MHKNHRIDFQGWQPVDNRLLNTLDSNSYMPEASTGARWAHLMSTSWSKSKHKEYTTPIADEEEETKGEKKPADTNMIEEKKEKAMNAPEVGQKRTFQEAELDMKEAPAETEVKPEIPTAEVIEEKNDVQDVTESE